MLNFAGLCLKFVDELLKHGHSNESYQAVLFMCIFVVVVAVVVVAMF